jgi:hypothetical protein
MQDEREPTIGVAEDLPIDGVADAESYGSICGYSSATFGCPAMRDEGHCGIAHRLDPIRRTYSELDSRI